jgi:hypothetical protein
MIALLRAQIDPPRLMQRHLFGRFLVSRSLARTFRASFSSIPLKGSYTAITEQLWRQREQAKLRNTSASSTDKCVATAPKLQQDTVVVYEFPDDPKLRDEYSNPWGDVRCDALRPGLAIEWAVGIPPAQRVSLSDQVWPSS